MVEAPNLKQMNVLLADDDIDDQNFFKKALEVVPLNTNLTIVADGEELMTYLFENSERLPHVLFLDINMPRKNGFEKYTYIILRIRGRKHNNRKVF